MVVKKPEPPVAVRDDFQPKLPAKGTGALLRQIVPSSAYGQAPVTPKKKPAVEAPAFQPVLPEGQMAQALRQAIPSSGYGSVLPLKKSPAVHELPLFQPKINYPSRRPKSAVSQASENSSSPGQQQLRDENANLKARLDSLQAVKADHSRTEDENRILKTRLRALQADQDRKVKELQEVASKTKDLEARLAQSQQDNGRLSTRIAELEKITTASRASSLPATAAPVVAVALPLQVTASKQYDKLEKEIRNGLNSRKELASYWNR